MLSLTLGLITRFAVAVAYYTTVQRRWEKKNIFEKISTWSTESQMGLALAIIPSIIYMVSKIFLILTQHTYTLYSSEIMGINYQELHCKQ